MREPRSLEGLKYGIFARFNLFSQSERVNAMNEWALLKHINECDSPSYEHNSPSYEQICFCLYRLQSFQSGFIYLCENSLRHRLTNVNQRIFQVQRERACTSTKASLPKTKVSIFCHPFAFTQVKLEFGEKIAPKWNLDTRNTSRPAFRTLYSQNICIKESEEYGYSM